jgi:hypothetical protein
VFTDESDESLMLVVLRFYPTTLLNSPSHPATTLTLTLSLTVDPAQYVTCEGVLSDIPLGEFVSGEMRQIGIGVCFLANGRFEMTAKVQCHRPRDEDSSAGIGELRALVRERKSQC